MSRTARKMMMASGGSSGGRRTGLVLPIGRAVSDDGGLFHPLGITWLWALYGQLYENSRIVDHATFLAPYHYDYCRILGQVKWPGREINPADPNYEWALGNFIDFIYGLIGMRVAITAVGGSPDDPIALAHTISRVTAARPEKIQWIECWNESFATGGNLATIKQMAQIFLAESGVHFVGLTSPGNGNDDDLAAAEDAVGATIRFRHTARQTGDDGWKMVRQAFDFKDIQGVVDSNEPPGPESSGVALSNPLQLAMMRATGVMEGAAMFVLHVGDMVQGIDDPAHGRVADLWNVPNIDQILKVVRSIDPWLPLNVENWVPKTLGHLDQPPQALVPDVAGWNTGTGVNRAYAALNGQQFSEVLLGIKDSTTLTLVAPGIASCRVQGFNPLTGQLLDRQLAAGEVWTVPGEPDGNSGYILMTV